MKTIREIRDRLQTMPDTDIRQEAIHLCEVLANTMARLYDLERKVERLAEGTGDWKKDR